MSELEEETVEILYNDCYGGFTPSKKAEELYKKYMLEINPTEEFDEWDATFVQRNCPIWLRVYHELGKEFNGKHSDVQVEKIPKRYQNCFSIHEYDGLEEVIIEYESYRLKQITTILKSNSNNDEKVHELNILWFGEQDYACK